MVGGGGKILVDTLVELLQFNTVKSLRWEVDITSLWCTSMHIPAHEH